jgi:hypothetical protein
VQSDSSHIGPARRFVPVVRDARLTQRHVAGPIGWVESDEPVEYFEARIQENPNQENQSTQNP